MEPNQFILLGAKRSAILVSGKSRNNADGLIWPTPPTTGKGLIVTPAGLRYELLVVNKDHGAIHALPANVKIKSNGSN